MSGKLISLGKNGQEKQAFPVVHLHVFIGSDSYCDLRIKSKGISPQHCLITSQKDKPALIRNLSRTLPTLVNGTQIGTKDIELQDQDVITIHNKQYKWQYDASHKHLNDDFGIGGKGRKSWPLFKDKLVAVVPPNRRDEGLVEADSTQVKELPLKKRRATVAFENASSKKNKVLGIKSGIKGARKSSAVKKISVKASPTSANTIIGHVALSGRKSVKFADSVFSSARRLGKRGKKSYGPATPYRASSTPGKGKSSLYFTPPSSFGSNKTPKKGILKTPGSQQPSASKVRFPVLNLSSGSPSGLSASLSNLDESREEESGFRTPPREESDQPDIVMRLSKRSSRDVSSANYSPRSDSKSKLQRDDSLEASERAAKKLKQDPPVAIDKKKMAALLLCHRKSLTPHPAVNRRGRTLLDSKPDSPVQPPTSPLSTPKSTKRSTKVIRKSEPTPYTKVVPKALRFGSLGNADTKPPKKKKKPPFKAVNLDRKNPISRAYTVAKMISTPSPPGRKMTRATRAARASREPVRRGEVTDVLSALDLSRKVPDPNRKTTSPVTNLSGIKELFSTEKTLDVRELFLESSTLDDSRQSRRASKGSEIEEGSLNSFGVEESNELPSSPPSLASLSSQAGSSTSRRSLSLKGPRTPLSSPKLLNESKGSSGKKKTLVKEPVSSPNLQNSITQFSDDSNFSLGSFNSSKHKSRDTSFVSLPGTSSTPQSPLNQSLSQKLNASPRSSIRKMKKSRVSLRRIALTSSTPKHLKISQQSLNEIEKIPVIDLTRDSPERQLPLKKRPLLSLTTAPQRNSYGGSVAKRSKSLPLKNLSSSKKNESSNKKSKNKTDISALNLEAYGKEVNSNSDTSLEVNIGSVRKNISDISLEKSSPSFKNKLSKSVNLKHHDVPKVAARHSAPGKVTKIRTSRKQILSTPFLEKPTRSNSFINVNLFRLDKSPMNIVSSTPIRIKPTRSKSEVNIDLFKLEDNLKKSKLLKSFTKNKILSKSLPPSKSRVSSIKLNTSELSVSSSLYAGDSSVSSSHFSPLKKPYINKKDLSTSKVSDNKKNSSSAKSIKSQSPVDIDLFKLDKSQRSFNNKLEINFGNTNLSSLRSPDFNKLTTERNLSKRESRRLDGNSISQNKSTRSRSSINIDLFKLDENPSLKEKSIRSKSAEGRKIPIASPKLSENKMKKSLGDVNVSPSKLKDSSALNDTERALVYKDKTPSSVTNKSTRSSSSVNIDLFKLDENPRISTAYSLKAENSFGGKSGERSVKRTYHAHEEAYDPSSMSFIDVSSSFKGDQSSSFSSERNSPDESQNIRNKSLESRRSILQKLEKSSSSISESPVKVNHSISLENKRSPVKSAKKVQHTNDASGNKSTRSRSSVNINLFRLDEKPFKQSIASRSAIDKSFRSKSAEGKLNSSKPSISSLSLSGIESRSSSNLRKSLVEADELNNLRSGECSRKSYKIQTSQSKVDLDKSGASESKLTRSRSSVNIDLFKLDDKPLNQSVLMSPGKDKSFRSKSAEGKLKSPTSSISVTSPSELKSSASKLRESVLKGAIKSTTKKKNESALNTSSANESKPTRSRSSVNIDLFKLDDKNFKGKSFYSTESKLEKLKVSVSSPKQSKLNKSKNHLSKSESSSPVKNTIEDNFKSDSALKNKSTRSQSSVSIDLFKLDEKPVDTSIKEVLNEKSIGGKLSENIGEKSSKTLQKNSISFKEAPGHSNKSPVKQVSFSQSDPDTSVSSQKLRKSLSEETISHSKLSRKRHSSDSLLGGANKSKIARKNLEESVLVQSESKSTRSRSSVNIDLFKLDEKHASLKSLSISNLQSAEKMSPMKRLLNNSLTNTILSPVASTPAVNIRKSKKSQIEISPIKRPKTSIKSDLKHSKIRNIVQDEEMSIQKAHSDVRQSEAFSLSSRKNLKQNSTLLSPKSSLSPQSKKHDNLMNKNKSTRGTTTVNIDLFNLDNESPLKQSKKSSLTPSLKKLALSPSKKLSSKSSLKVNYSPKVYLTPLTATQLKQIKETQTLTPPKIVYDSKHTQTSTTVTKSKRRSNKKQMQLDLFTKIPIINFANNTTPICNYEFKTKALGSPKAKRSLRQKEIDESDRSPEYSTNDRTPLSAFSPKGRRSVTEKQTPINRSSSSTQTPLGDKYKVLNSGIDSTVIKSKSEVSMRSKTISSPNEESTKPPLRNSLKPRDQVESTNSKHSKAGKSQIGTPVLQDFVIDSTEVSGSTDFKKRTKQGVIEKKPNKKSSPSGSRRGRPAKAAKMNVASPKLEKTSFPAPIQEKSSPKSRRGRSTKAASMNVASPKPEKTSHPAPIQEKSSPMPRRGRPAKAATLNVASPKREETSHPAPIQEKTSPKPRRGRPAKAASINVASPKLEKTSHPAPIQEKSSPKSRRGRPAKAATLNVASPKQDETSHPAPIQEKSSPVKRHLRRRAPKVVSLKVISPKQNKVVSSPIIKNLPPNRKHSPANPNVVDNVSAKLKINDDPSFQKDQSTIVNESKPRRGRPLKVISLKVILPKQNKVVSSPIVKSSPLKGKRTRTNQKGTDDDVSVIQRNAVNESIPRRGRSPKIVSLKAPSIKQNQVLNSPPKGKRTKANQKVIDDEAPAKQRNKKDDVQEISSAVNNTKPPRGRPTKVISLKITSPKQNKVLHSPIIKSSPLKSRSTRANPRVSVKQNSSFQKEIRVNKEVKDTKSRQRNILKAEKSIKPEDALNRICLRGPKSGNEPSKTSVERRGGSKENTEVQKPPKPEVARGRKRRKAAKSPEKGTTNSPVGKRGRSEPSGEVLVPLKPETTPEKKRPKAAKSPEKVSANSQVVKRGRPARNAEVHDLVVILDRKRPRGVKSPEKAATKSPVHKRGRSGEVQESSTSKSSSKYEKPSEVIDKVKTLRAKVKGGEAPDPPPKNTRRITGSLVISPKVQLGVLAKTKIAPKSVKLRKMKASITGEISPAVTRRGQSAKSQASKNSILSHSSTKRKHSEDNSKKKANLKTVMKATQQRKIDLTSKVQKIMKLSGSSILEEAKRATRFQKKKGGRK